MKHKKKAYKCNYETYDFSYREKICVCVEYLMLLSLINYLCYRSWWFYIIGFPFGFVYFIWKRNQKMNGRRKKMKYQFLDVLHSLQSAVKAGYSMEQSISICEKEISQIYGVNQEWVKEFRHMEAQLKVGISIEVLWKDLSERMHIEDVKEFADILVICRRSGGNMNTVMEKCERILGEKIRTEKEIAVTVSGKKFEHMIMSCIPAGFILYMQSSSEQFLNVLYHNIFGNMIMSGCLLLYGISFWQGRKLVKITI